MQLVQIEMSTDRSKTLLDNSLKEVLDDKKVSQALLLLKGCAEAFNCSKCVSI